MRVSPFSDTKREWFKLKEPSLSVVEASAVTQCLRLYRQKDCIPSTTRWNISSVLIVHTPGPLHTQHPTRDQRGVR